jgi:YidC/Oxa1 family membrane protein insertase
MTLALLTSALAAVFAKSSGGITLDPIAKPIAAILAFFYSLIPNYAVSIILLTVLMMIVLTPLTIKQTRSMLVMQKLQPELKRLQEQHKNDRQALNEAVMALYKEHNANPLGGCLPMLLPLPVFFALFRVLEGLARLKRDPLTHQLIPSPKYLTHTTQMYKDIVLAHGHLDSFGLDLAKSAANVAGTFWDKLPYFVLLLLMVGTQYYQQRQLTSRNPQATPSQQQAIMKFIPIFFGVISIRFPAGVVLYWTVSNAIRIFQQWAMYRYDPKVKQLVEADVKEVEARTRDIDEKEGKPAPGRPRLRDLLAGPTNGAAQKPATGGSGGRGRSSGAGGRTSGAGGRGSAGGGSSSAGRQPAKGSTGNKPASGTAKSSGAKPSPKTPTRGAQGNGSGNGGTSAGKGRTGAGGARSSGNRRRSRRGR